MAASKRISTQMKHVILLIISAFSLINTEAQTVRIESSVKLSQLPNKMELSALKDNGLIILQKQQLQPNSKGVIHEFELQLPGIKNGLYFRPFSLFQGNHSAPVWFSDYSELDGYKATKPDRSWHMEQGSFLLLQKASGKYLAILPIVSKYACNTLSAHDNAFHIVLGTYGSAPVNEELPLLAFAESDNPYMAAHMAWKNAKEAPNVKGNVNWRADKKYPEAFKYLGWCSWEYFRENIDEEIILNAISDIKSSSLPIRWVLVDDGYLDADGRRLLSFGVNKKKFPNAWKPIIDQKDDKIKWMGIWRNYNGYMDGVSPNHTMNNLSSDFTEVAYKDLKRWMPKMTRESANRFYNEMITATKNDGFDMLKVDFQTAALRYNQGTANPVLGIHYNNSALEQSCKNADLGLLNCIAMGNVNVFNQSQSCVIRGGMDYTTTFDRVDFTLVQCMMNSFWLGHIHWIDYDEFHTSFKGTGRVNAVARALSGGPMYLSDDPKSIVDTYLKPAMYNDGKLVGTLAPGVPLPQSLMSNPYSGSEPLSVIAPLKNKTAAIMSVNFNRTKRLKGKVSLDDYQYASGMMQPNNKPWKMPSEGLVLYDVHEQKAIKLENSHSFELSTREDKLFQLTPIENDWCIIGRPDKYLPGGTFEILKSTRKEIKIKMVENGDLVLWSKNKTPESENFRFAQKENGLWYGELTITNSTMVYVIRSIENN